MTEVDQTGEALAIEKVDYIDQVPSRQVHTQTLAGSDLAPFYVDHYRYVDSFGETIASVDGAGIAGALEWRVSGVHSHDSRGRISQTYRPFYLLGPFSSPFPAATFPYTGPTETFTYDALGRVLTTTDYNGNVTTKNYHPAALTVDTIDPEQSSSGTHQGSMNRVTMDGHGRVIQTVARLANASQGSGDVTTTTAYQATGEPTSITETSPGGTVTRWMQYDSLGRMVFNAEPNTSTGFSATPGAPGVSWWTYAYNDSSQLVGASDARGCGKNIFHDGAGRVVAEDYSPCDASQPAYTAPNLTTGDGTEAFYAYDSPAGMLTDVQDRGAHTHYFYDTRDRISSVTRQIATPTGDPSLGLRYASNIFTKTLQYT
ncbi:MAG: hypothetical protein ACREJ3_07100, partial [Polyangiaceae bacterium]